MSMNTSGFGALALTAMWASAGWAAPQDAERATHGDEATTPQLSYERRAGEVTVR